MSSGPHQTIGWGYDSDGDSSCNSGGGGKYGGHRCFACGKRGHFARSCPQRVASSSYDSDGENSCKSGGGGGGEGGFRRCFSCGEAGHIARNCRICYCCNQRGHFARDCPKSAGGVGRGRGRGRGRGSACYNCGEFGHLMRNCTSHGGERSSNGSWDTAVDLGVRAIARKAPPFFSIQGGWDGGVLSGIPMAADTPPSLRGFSLSAMEIQSSWSSNEGDKDKTLYDQPLIATRIQPSSSNVGYLNGGDRPLLGSSLTVTETQSSCSSNEGDHDKTLSDQPMMATRIQPSSSNVGYLIGGDRALLGSSSTVTETQSSCSSNEGDHDKPLSDQPMMATRIQPSSSNVGYLNGGDRALLGNSSTVTETQSSCSSNEGDHDKTWYDQPMMATRIQPSSSNVGYLNGGDRALLGNSSTATETQSSCSSNEGDKDKTWYDQPMMATRIQPSSSNVGYLNGGDRTLLGNSSTATETQSSCSSNDGDKDLYDQPMMATRIQPSSSNVEYNNKAFSARAPIIIEISSSSSSEGEDDDDDYSDDDDEDEWEEVEEEEQADVGKHIPSLVVRVKTEKGSQKEVGDDDCCILDFNPFERPTIQFKHKLSLSVEHPSIPQDDDISIIAERGQVACRDYPHSRHLCGNLPFENTSHESYCPQCYCYVCDMVAPCALWNGNLGHCHATDLYDGWKLLRSTHLMKKSDHT